MTVSETKRHNEAVLAVNEALTGNAVEYIEWQIQENYVAAGQLVAHMRRAQEARKVSTAEDES